MDNLKESVCNALATWIRQRPGLEFGNYGSVASYQAELRSIARDKRDAETLLAAVRWRESITGQDIIEAARHAYSGRMTIVANRVEYPNQTPDYGYSVRIDYCTGQYWPTEYRRAAAAVLAGALWTYARDNMPAPCMHRVQWEDGRTQTLPLHAAAEIRATDRTAYVTDLYRMPGGDSKALSAGDYLRRKFCAEFGSALQRRWFD